MNGRLPQSCKTFKTMYYAYMQQEFAKSLTGKGGMTICKDCAGFGI